MTKFIIPMAVVSALIFNPGLLQAKANDDQNQIILLNDAAAALEDSNPALSQRLTEFADEKEKEWEYKNADKEAAPSPLADKKISLWREQIKLLKAAALAVGPAYPLIAQGLDKMAKEMDAAVEIKK